MDKTQLTTLAECLRNVPDPRCRRGCRHEWSVILTVIAAGLLCGQRHFRAIGQWARANRPLLTRYLRLWRGQVPSEKTLQRAMGLLDLAAFKREAYEYISGSRPPADGPLEAISIDGKTLRGASHGGRKVHLLTLAAHADGAVLARRNVGLKTNEIAVAPLLLRDRDLHGQVITGDAMFCQRELSRQVIRQGGHWGIEHNVNRAQDVVFGEDASTLRTGTAPEAMSVMRDLVIHILHHSVRFALSDKLRYSQAYPAKALLALGLRRL